jgi:hypothetical protein
MTRRMSGVKSVVVNGTNLSSLQTTQKRKLLDSLEYVIQYMQFSHCVENQKFRSVMQRQ